MATQHFKRNLLLNLYREEKISLVCFLLLYNRDKYVWHLQPLSCVWIPLAFLPLTLSKASGGDEISVKLLQILEDDAVKVLHSICQ